MTGSKVGLLESHALRITYPVPELVFPWIIIAAQVMTNRQMKG
ncbi:hypothetical protein J2W51_004820 [Tardiphaga robiniae]|nr:hypothetical protein [Tardiphaga robiniae]MDR6662230.1 hypothetical protein [Tardiphaga robiniae]